MLRYPSSLSYAAWVGCSWRYHIVVPGRRTKVIDVITTLTDAEEYTTEEVAELYGFRWNSELDIRSIKESC